MKTLRVLHLILVLLLIWLVTPLAAAADTPSCKLPTYDARLDRRYSKGPDGAFSCIAGQTVATRLEALRKAFYGNETLAKAGPAVMLSTWPQIAREQLELLRATGIQLPADSPASLTGAVDAYRSALKQFTADLALMKTVDDWSAQAVNAPAELVPNYWKVDSTPRPEPGGRAAQYLSDEGCLTADPGARCEAAFGRATVLADEIFLVDEIVSIMTSKQRSHLVTESASRESRWHSYLYDAQFQYWWELALNRTIEARCPVWLRWDCDPPTVDERGNQIGDRQPPRQKVMFLHPDVGLEYLSHEQAGQRLKPVLIFQWFGYQRWRWDNDAVSGLKGIALVSSISDTASVNKVGTGIQLLWQKYGIAVTLHSGHVGISISRSLIDEVQSVNPEWAKKLRAPLPK